MFNALEIAELGAAKVIKQSDLTPDGLTEAIRATLEDRDGAEMAAKVLAEWDIPDAAERILTVMTEATQR